MIAEKLKTGERAGAKAAALVRGLGAGNVLDMLERSLRGVVRKPKRKTKRQGLVALTE